MAEILSFTLGLQLKQSLLQVICFHLIVFLHACKENGEKMTIIVIKLHVTIFDACNALSMRMCALSLF